MPTDFQQLDWTADVEDDCRHIVRLAVREDLDRLHDWTTLALVPPDRNAAAAVVFRAEGVVAGLRACEVILREMNVRLQWTPRVVDGDAVHPGTVAGQLSGSCRDLLVCERLLLNFIGHLSGIATLTSKFVAAVVGTSARIYDTRKTTPGWRRLEKYAVRCGGGQNHRTGLYDAILIKDNHLAACGESGRPLAPSQAVQLARSFVEAHVSEERRHAMPIEVEVDTLEQLANVLPIRPDIVLLDNMTPDELRKAVDQRNCVAPGVQLEASGGINLQTVAGVAASGVDRISVGALTHSAVALDCGLDWEVSTSAGTR